MNQEKQNYDDLDAVRKVAEALQSFNDEERIRIVKWACEKLGVKQTIGQSLVAREEVSQLSERTDAPKDIRTFVASKKPKNDIQFATVVAYFYKFEAPEQERKESLTGEDLKDATRKTDYKRLKRPAQTLINAYQVGGFLDKTDQGYKINSVGENLVVMVLPNNENSEKILGKTRKQGKKRIVKKKSKTARKGK